MDDDSLTMEYRTGNVTYAMARPNAGDFTRRADLKAFVNCACQILRLPGKKLFSFMDMTCDDAAD